MIKVATRPQWVLLFIFVMVVAGVFAWLGQWQVGRAIEDAQPVDAQFETVIPLDQLTPAGETTPETAGGHMTVVEGTYAPGSFTFISGRLNQDVPGYWVIGRFITSEEPLLSVPIAMGWSESKDVALSVMDTFNEQTSFESAEIIGRFMPTEAPGLPPIGEDPYYEETLSVSALVNQWPGFAGLVYGGYIVADVPPAGMNVIDSIPPINEASIDWLNIFYAIEWAVFAVFAFYIWWRMVRDVYERELEEEAERRGEVN